MPLFDFTGNAVLTSLNSSISDTDMSMTLVDGTNWPDGSDGNWTATLERAVDGQEEKVLCGTRSGDTPATVTIIERGYDGTTAVAHDTPANVEHTISAVFAREASAHVNVTTRDDHCFSEDTEILTEHGWLGIDAVEDGMNAWTFNLDTGRADLDRIEAVWRYNAHDFPELIELSTQDLGQLLVTPRHTMIWRRANNHRQADWQRRPADTLPRQFSIPASACGHDRTVDLSDDQIALLAWATTEGHIGDNGVVTIAQKNGPFADRLRGIIDRLGYPYTEYKQRGDMRSFRMRSGFLMWAMDDEKVPRWELTRMSGHQARLFIAEIILGDGSVSGGDKLARIDAWLAGEVQPTMVLATKSARYVDFVQTLCVLNGIKTRCYTDPDGFHRLAIKSTREHTFACSTSPTASVGTVPNDYGRVWCVTVGNGTVIARRPGSAPFVAGNTQYLNNTRHDTPTRHGTSTIADDAITTAKIDDGAVTTAKLANDAVTNTKIADDAVDDAAMFSGDVRAIAAVSTEPSDSNAYLWVDTDTDAWHIWDREATAFVPFNVNTLTGEPPRLSVVSFTDQSITNDLFSPTLLGAANTQWDTDSILENTSPVELKPSTPGLYQVSVFVLGTIVSGTAAMIGWFIFQPGTNEQRYQRVTVNQISGGELNWTDEFEFDGTDESLQVGVSTNGDDVQAEIEGLKIRKVAELS